MYVCRLKTKFHVLFRLKIKINHTNISIHVQKTKFHMRVYKLMTFFKYCSTEPNYRLFPVFSAVLPVWAWLSICDVISYKSVMIMFILTINYVVLLYYEMILFQNLDKKQHSFYIHTHEAFRTLPKFESNGSYFRSEYQSNKEYAVFTRSYKKYLLKSRKNNNLIFIVSHVT